MTEFSNPVLAFSIGAIGAWLFALRWALTRPKYRWYYVWMLGLVTMFWWLGESIAIRLGKYRYANFPFTLPIPGGDSPTAPSDLTLWLRKAMLKYPLAEDLDPTCVAQTWDIPFPVIAIEAALLFGFFRFAVWLLQRGREGRLRPALATGALCAILMVNVFAVLDPVVSKTWWCGTGDNPNGTYLSYGLWTWFTTAEHPGYWYGVPLVNYAAWFLTAAAFGVVARWDDERPGGVIRKHKAIWAYLLATVAVTIIYFTVLISSKKVVDGFMNEGENVLNEWLQREIVTQRQWQFIVMGILVALALFGLFKLGRRRRPRRPIEPITLVPKVVAFLFCLMLLIGEFHGGIATVWAATVVIAAIALLWPTISPRVYRSEPADADGVAGDDEPDARV